VRSSWGWNPESGVTSPRTQIRGALHWVGGSLPQSARLGASAARVHGLPVFARRARDHGERQIEAGGEDCAPPGQGQSGVAVHRTGAGNDPAAKSGLRYSAGRARRGCGRFLPSMVEMRAGCGRPRKTSGLDRGTVPSLRTACPEAGARLRHHHRIRDPRSAPAGPPPGGQQKNNESISVALGMWRERFFNYLIMQ